MCIEKPGLSKSQTNQIESIQRRVMRIIVSFTCYMPYSNTLLLQFRTWQNAETYFHMICLNPCSHITDTELISRLRVPSKFPRIPNETKKYQMFFTLALSPAFI